MSPHTQGPWVVESDGHYPVVRKRFRPDHHMDVCGPVHGYMYSTDQRAEQTANARLIAAAPDLLEALKPFAEVLADVGEDEADDDLYRAMSKAHRRAPAITVGHLRAALAAIAKATGQ